MSFFTGRRGEFQQRPLIGPEQVPLYQQLVKAGLGPGAGGAFGEAGDYYRSLLSDDNSTFQSMAAPEMRRFREDIIPGLGEQFAGMGSGALSSSGFRNAAVNAGTDLSERLGAIRAQLRQQGAAGLMGLGQQGLQRFHENVYFPGQEGLLGSLASGIGSAIPALAGGFGLGGALASLGANWLNPSQKGQSGAYGGRPGRSLGLGALLGGGA